MKYLTILLLGFVVFGFAPAGSDDDYEDLLAIYIDEEYDKLVDKAMKYVESDKTKKDPMPYLYVSMGYYEMSKDGKYREREDFKNLQKNALKFAYKFRGKDKKVDFKYWDEAQTYLSELRATVIQDAENNLDEQKTLKKALYIYKYLAKIDPEDGTAWMMKGYCELQLNLISEAVKSFNIGMPLIYKIGSVDDIEEEQAYLLKFGLMKYADYLVENSMVDSARKTIDIGTLLFEGNEAYSKKVDEINSK